MERALEDFMMSIASQVGQNTFRIGSYGPVVEAIQLGLKQCGYALTGTGYFGPATDTAVEAFQKRAGLVVDGTVGNRTAVALDAAMKAPVGSVAPTIAAEVGRPLWLEAGIDLIGTMEVPGVKSNPVIIDWAKDLGGDIAKSYTHDSIPFCALFVGFCLLKAGLKGTGTLWALDYAGKWPSTKLAGPAVGAVAPMLRNGGGHVVFIVGKDQHGNFMCLGSNQSDTTSIIPFSAARLNQGFWWPQGVTMPSRVGLASLPIVKSNGKVSSNEA
jgi:uncharacterized protein (TIGR02594 family)